ncbi:MAG: hypothetical protein ACXWYE_10835 [Actinomycetota bacterium]
MFASIPAEGHTAAVGDRHDVHRALAALPAGQREALVLIAAPSGAGDRFDGAPRARRPGVRRVNLAGVIHMVASRSAS